MLASSQRVGRQLPSSRLPIQPTPGSGNQVWNVVIDKVAVGAQLMSPVEQRFYRKSQGAVTIENVNRQLPGAIERYETMIHEDPRYALEKENIAFQYLGADMELMPFPTVEALRHADANRRHGGRSRSIDSADDHMYAQTTLAGMPDPAPLSKDWRLKQRLLMSRVRCLGKVTTVDTKESQNGRTVVHGAGPQDLRWIDGSGAGLPGYMIEVVPLSPDEIAMAAMPEDEANEHHHNNPHLVARVVHWQDHDLSYKPTFDTLVAGKQGWADSLVARVAALDPLTKQKVELLDEDFLNRYEKAWYNLLYAAYAMFADAPTFEEFHTTALPALATRLSGFSSKQWQDAVSRGNLAKRELCLNHDSSIIGRLCYYTEKKEQNLYAPLFIGNI